jgi:hypothetical protein
MHGIISKPDIRRDDVAFMILVRVLEPRIQVLEKACWICSQIPNSEKKTGPANPAVKMILSLPVDFTQKINRFFFPLVTRKCL